MSKTMSLRMDRENYDFLHEITKEEGSDLSKAVRGMVTRGRILLAVERYESPEGGAKREDQKGPNQVDGSSFCTLMYQVRAQKKHNRSHL